MTAPNDAAGFVVSAPPMLPEGREVAACAPFLISLTVVAVLFDEGFCCFVSSLRDLGERKRIKYLLVGNNYGVHSDWGGKIPKNIKLINYQIEFK